jgi:hypothetical protein
MDPSPGEEITRRLRPWESSRDVLASWLPDGFDAYARILHPAFRGGDNVGSTRWSRLAELNGRLFGPETGFAEVSGARPGTRPWMDSEPSNGCLPQPHARALARILRAFTATPDQCWFCIWDGYGIWPGRLTLWFKPGESEDEREQRHRAAREKAERESRALARIPLVHTQHRDYFLFTGPVSAVGAFMFGRTRYQSPNLWWPEDHSWCVATELDRYSTYVGGSTEAIQDVLSTANLEAIEVTADVRMDPGPYC